MTAELDLAMDAALDEAGGAGVARVDRGGDVLLDRAWGVAERRLGIPMTPTHKLAMASGSKGFTALAVAALVERGVLTLDTTARSLLGDDLPLVDDAVTVEHLLGHRSGIGDYLDDDADPGEYLMSLPVHRLVSPEDYLPMLAGHPQQFPPGTDFAYCNGGFVLLALLAQRAAGRPFHDLVQEYVLDRAGLAETGYLRSDDLPGDAALGYVEVAGQWRQNVLHLPVIGGGDGGAYTTTADMARFWRALAAGAIVGPDLVAELTRPRSRSEDWEYGLGVWVLDSGTGLLGLVGQDAGVSFLSWYLPSQDLAGTVIGTTADAAWPVASALQRALGLSD